MGIFPHGVILFQAGAEIFLHCINPQFGWTAVSASPNTAPGTDLNSRAGMDTQNLEDLGLDWLWSDPVNWIPAIAYEIPLESIFWLGIFLKRHWMCVPRLKENGLSS